MQNQIKIWIWIFIGGNNLNKAYNIVGNKFLKVVLCTAEFHRVNQLRIRNMLQYYFTVWQIQFFQAKTTLALQCMYHIAIFFFYYSPDVTSWKAVHYTPLSLFTSASVTVLFYKLIYAWGYCDARWCTRGCWRFRTQPKKTFRTHAKNIKKSFIFENNFKVRFRVKVRF